MKVKILSSYPKQTFKVDKLWFSSDLHLDHDVIIKFGRKFDTLAHMNDHILYEINRLVRKDDMLVLLGDTMMGEKDYSKFLNSLICENVILLVGNHCSRSKLLSALRENDKLVYLGEYLELNVDKQIICCSHFPMFNFNYQDDGAIMVHGHTHGDESDILKQIHEYKCMDVGIDSYYNMFGEYSVFSFEQICEILKDKKIIRRHGINE
jgi:calcineurin-like phosphoesterase family protein